MCFLVCLAGRAQRLESRASKGVLGDSALCPAVS